MQTISYATIPATDLKVGDRTIGGEVVTDIQPGARYVTSEQTLRIRVTRPDRTGREADYPLDSEWTVERHEVRVTPEEMVVTAIGTIEDAIREQEYLAAVYGGGSSYDEAMRRAAEMQQVLDTLLWLDTRA
jgi:hypothetical protein